LIYKIKLKNANSYVLIDDTVYEWLNSDPHYADIKLLENLRLHSSGCAVFQKTWQKPAGDGYRIETIYLHKIIAERYLSAQKKNLHNPVVGALNHDKLDCRLENLVYRDRSTASRQRRTRNSTGYTGVYMEHSRYRAIISINGKAVHLGMFDTPEEAALAYNKKSKEIYGEKGKINKIRTL
jgi:hypothetical protein